MADRPTLPQMRPSLPGAASTGAVSSGGTTISVSAASGNARSFLRPVRERLLIAGDSVSGKSYAYMRMARREFDLAQAENRAPARFFILDTDDTAPTFFQTGYEFEDLYVENGGNCYVYPAFNYAESRNAYASIVKEAGPDDYIVIDVVNRVYDQCMWFVAKTNGKDLDDATFQRSQAGKGFGAFQPDEWLQVRRAFEAIIWNALYQFKGHVIFVQHLKEKLDIATRPERRELMMLFDELGLKPEGAPRLPTQVRTIVCLWSVRQVKYDDRKVRISEKSARFMAVVKDKGQAEWSGRLVYDRDMYDILLEWRTSKVRPANVIGKAAELLNAEVKEALRLESETTDTSTTTSTGADE